jgi:protein phosphatase
MSETLRDLSRAILARPVENAPFHRLSMSIALELGAASACGRSHAHNTDHYLALRFGRLQETLLTSLADADLPAPFEEYAYSLVVADGIGEHGSGARASRIALSALAHLAIRYGKWNVRVDADTTSTVISQSEFLYRQLNDAIRRAGHEHLELSGMAASLTALYIAEGHLFFSHVGHSRAYLFRNGALSQLTRDHTLGEERHGPALASAVPYAAVDADHVVLEALGERAMMPNVDIEHIALAPDDRLLLCTNGLSDVVSHEKIADVLALQRRPTDDCHQLIELARQAGCPDDATVMIAAYREKH